jgi:hypothetical protein
LAKTLTGVAWGSLFSALIALSALAAEPLFPAPLHLTRSITDPFTGRTTVVEEYFLGDRSVAIRGHLTTIADHARGELTQIDRRSGTYSITPFAQFAAAALTPGDKKATVTVARRGREVVAERTVDVVEGDFGDRRVVIAGDREIRVSRQALEVLLGAAWPNQPNPELELILAAKEKTASGPATDTFPLPLRQTVTYDIAGETLEIRSEVVRVGSELAPPESTSIPPGARRIESKAVTRSRTLEELDSLTSRVRTP